MAKSQHSAAISYQVLNFPMPETSERIAIHGLIGACGQRPVFLGFAPADLLHRLSFADVLDEETGEGYQRPIHAQHSLEFRHYIQREGATTIPLTLNLRENRSQHWQLNIRDGGFATLEIDTSEKIFAQVDCQHRLGFLDGLTIPLAFMTFVRLSRDEEREVFTTINSKAKGLSGTLIDLNASRLAKNLSKEAPHLYVAVSLADDDDSPWHNRLRKGGATTLGLKKPASLRMMKNAAARYLRALDCRQTGELDRAVEFAKSFWRAIAIVYPDAWEDPRHHFIAKGVGIYSLMSLAGQLARDALALGNEPDDAYFLTTLSRHLAHVDWSRGGPLESFNGEKGAEQALAYLRAEMQPEHSIPRESQWLTRTSF